MTTAINRAIEAGDLSPDVVVLILDKLDTFDLANVAKSGLFAVGVVDDEHVRRRCRETKKRRLVEGGDLAALKRIRKKRNARFVLQDMTLAAKGGHLDVVIWLRKHADGGYPCRVVQEAAAGGHLAVVKWLCESGRIAIRPMSIDASIDGAAKQGHVDVIRYLAAKHAAKGTALAMFWAVRNGHADALQCLCEIAPENACAYYCLVRDREIVTADTIRAGGDDDDEDGKDKTANMLKPRVVDKDKHAAFGLFDLACLTGRMHIIEWLWQRKLGKWTCHLYDLAAIARGTDVLDFLYARRPSLEAGIAPDGFDYETIFKSAILDGSVAKAAAWHLVMRAPIVLSRANVANVAFRGHLDMIKFLMAKGVLVEYRSCLLAACEGGRADVVTFMIDAGADVDERAVEKAAQHGHSNIVSLLYKRAGDIRVGKRVLNEAVRHCDADVVALLRNIGRAPVESSTLIRSVLRGRPDVVAVLCDDEEKAPRLAGDVDYAAAVACAVAHPKFDVDAAIDCALDEGNLRAIDALLDVRSSVPDIGPYYMPDQFCQCAHFDAIHRVANRCDIVWDDEDCTVNDAITRGSARVVQWFHARGLLDGQHRVGVVSAAGFAADDGKRSTVEFLWEHGFRPTSMRSPPHCDVCDDRPAEDHCAARMFLRQKIADAAALDDDVGRSPVPS
nr:ankyrin repeat [Pandoravirus massiliensis]